VLLITAGIANNDVFTSAEERNSVISFSVDYF